MNSLIEVLKEKYDYILFDTPPVQVVSDAISLSRHVGGVLLVVRQNYVSEKDVVASSEALKLANANIIGTVLNMTNNTAKKHSYYGRYGNYHK
jgi:Mrp family chromosome partitioning ATPase